MLTAREAQSQPDRPNGHGRASLAELRRQLADPSGMTERARQRLLELASRVSRVQALGGEYHRVGLSEQAAAAMCGAVGVA